jgi:hypothetical protein
VRQNVALVESSRQELNQRYAAEQASEEAAFGAASVMPVVPTVVTRAVDLEFLTALDSAIATV